MRIITIFHFLRILMAEEAPGIMIPITTAMTMITNLTIPAMVKISHIIVIKIMAVTNILMARITDITSITTKKLFSEV